jgi:hypothetical protein
VKVHFADRESVLAYANAVLVLGSSIPYGDATPPKRFPTCGALDE